MGFRPRAALFLAGMPLLAQGLPPVPTAMPLEAPDPALLLPLRPWDLEEGPEALLPFAYRAERVTALGDIWTFEVGKIESSGLMLLADKITYDRARKVIRAEGNIRLEAPDLRLHCAFLEMDWRDRDGEARDLRMELPPSWTLRADRVSFKGLRTWAFDRVELSPCSEEKPGWTALLSRMDVDLDQFATFRNLRILVHGVPTHIYLPWGFYPAKAERSSGLLPPDLRFGGALGPGIGLNWYQTLGDQADATLSPIWFSHEGLLNGGELRWRPDPTHSGSFAGQSINQRSLDERRYRYQLKEVWQREDGWWLTADVNQSSDNLVDVDFGRGSGSLGTPIYDSSVYLGRAFTWGSVSLNLGENRTFFVSKDQGDPFYSPDFPASLRRQTLPTAQIRLYPVALGNFYLDGGLTSGRFVYKIDGTDTVPGVTYPWTRSDAHVRFYGRLGQVGPFRVDTELLGRATQYGATLESAVFSPEAGGALDPNASTAFDPFRVTGEGTRRLLASGHLRFSGPQLGRVFENFSLFGYSGELKHIVEPFFGYTTTGPFSEAARVPRFDALDARPGANDSASGEQSIEVGLKQHFFGRSQKLDAFADLVRWKISTRFYVKPVLLADGRVKQGWASLDSDVDVEPNEKLRLSFHRSSDLAEGGTDQSLSADVATGRDSRLSLSLFSTSLNRFLVRQQGIQLGGLQRFWDDRLRLEFSSSYDWRNHYFTSSQIGLAYVEPCVAYTLRYTHIQLPGLQLSARRQDQVELIITLKTLGELVKF
ncbi:MAG TPA: putative LPS assembly protein LptD [Holophagaceae bacterium]|nr:putative LPS assembly protein LptD [Holophagaceae bacterium]